MPSFFCLIFTHPRWRWHICTYRDSNHFAGAIDEVALFNRALSGDEIKKAYAVVHLSMPQAGLVAYWTFDEGVGRRSADKSGFGNHAILRRGTQWYCLWPNLAQSG